MRPRLRATTWLILAFNGLMLLTASLVLWRLNRSCPNVAGVDFAHCLDAADRVGINGLILLPWLGGNLFFAVLWLTDRLSS